VAVVAGRLDGDVLRAGHPQPRVDDARGEGWIVPHLVHPQLELGGAQLGELGFGVVVARPEVLGGPHERAPGAQHAQQRQHRPPQHRLAEALDIGLAQLEGALTQRVLGEELLRGDAQVGHPGREGVGGTELLVHVQALFAQALLAPRRQPPVQRAQEEGFDGLFKDEKLVGHEEWTLADELLDVNRDSNPERRTAPGED